MYYDEKSGTWFTSELHAYKYHTTGATWAAEEAQERRQRMHARDAWHEYDLMTERAGNYETGVDLLADALYRVLSGQVTTRANRNALRAELETALPVHVLEEETVSKMLRPERDSRGRVA